MPSPPLSFVLSHSIPFVSFGSLSTLSLPLKNLVFSTSNYSTNWSKEKKSKNISNNKYSAFYRSSQPPFPNFFDLPITFYPFLQTRTFFDIPSILKPKENIQSLSVTRILKFTPDQVYSVVVDIDKYYMFVPHCQRSRVLFRDPQTNKDGSGKLKAEMIVGFGPIHESYVSDVTFLTGKYVKVDVRTGRLFDFLLNTWEFRETPEGYTEITFHVRFKFHSVMYRNLSELFLTQVYEKMVGAFDQRCRMLYGVSKGVTRNEINRSDTKS